MFVQLVRKINAALARGLQCKSDVSDSARSSRRKAGFTLVELMVVIIIVNLLSGVAVPKLTDLIERTRQKLDVIKLFQLRDALNRALYEDNVSNVNEGKHGSCGDVNKSSLDTYLKSNKGVSLFIIQRSSSMPVNYQGVQGQAKSNNMCGLMYSGGFWSTAFKEAGFEAVADIIADRSAGDKINQKSSTYTATKNQLNNSWWRTYPKKPIFMSKFLTSDPTQTTASNTSIVLRVRWSGGLPESNSLEVFFSTDAGDYQSALRSRQGVCFSTIGDAGCRNTR